MSAVDSDQRSIAGAGTHDVRPPVPGAASTAGARRLDDVDRAILAALAADARMPNNALAAAVGVAPSTCLARVRALRDNGSILGFHAEIDPAALGLPLQAVISVRLQAGARDQLRAFTDRVRVLPQVRSIYFLAGADDFLLHVVASDPAALRDFVLDQLSAHHEVAATETQLIFDHIRGASPSA
jgi:DNA-binding Lrp family transcriptional regulator